MSFYLYSTIVFDSKSQDEKNYFLKKEILSLNVSLPHISQKKDCSRRKLSLKLNKRTDVTKYTLLCFFACEPHSRLMLIIKWHENRHTNNQVNVCLSVRLSVRALASKRLIWLNEISHAQ